MVSTVGLALGLLFTVVAVVLHFSKGTAWDAAADISEDVLAARARSVPETDFPEPMNRSIGGGGAVGAIAGGDAGELEGEDAEPEEEWFDPDSVADDDVEYFEVEFVNEGKTVEVANNESLLEAGEDEGWDLPYACREGQCVSCAGKIQDGPADDFIQFKNNEILDDDELDNGYVLTCVAYPTADFSLETNTSP